MTLGYKKLEYLEEYRQGVIKKKINLDIDEWGNDRTLIECLDGEENKKNE